MARNEIHPPGGFCWFCRAAFPTPKLGVGKGGVLSFSCKLHELQAAARTESLGLLELNKAQLINVLSNYLNQRSVFND